MNQLQIQQLEILKNIAISKNGKCLSNTYINNKTKIDFICSKGHKWSTMPYNIININTWCPICAGKNHNANFIKIKKIAESKGGKCLSTEYITVKDKLEFQCKYGHIWKTQMANIQQGSWCPYCSKKYLINDRLEELQQIAESKGGKCLSTAYINNKTKMDFICLEGHKWSTMPIVIKRGQWCPICAISERSINRIHNNDCLLELQQISQSKGGRCLSTTYLGSKTKLNFECKNKHIWMATPDRIKNGTWCPICCYKNKI